MFAITGTWGGVTVAGCMRVEHPDVKEGILSSLPPETLGLDVQSGLFRYFVIPLFRIPRFSNVQALSHHNVCLLNLALLATTLPMMVNTDRVP